MERENVTYQLGPKGWSFVVGAGALACSSLACAADGDIDVSSILTLIAAGVVAGASVALAFVGYKIGLRIYKVLAGA